MNRLHEDIGELAEIVGRNNVLTEIYDLLPYARDRYPPLVFPSSLKIPLAVVRPATTDEVKEIVLWANKHKVPLVPRGSGTSFSGSATPTEKSVVVDLSRMNRIIYLDEDALNVKVQAGITVKELEETLNQRGFTFPHDPGSFPSSTIGGGISTNGLGWRVGKYGYLKDLVISLQAVLPNGTIIETRNVPKSSTGLDIKSIFIGTEGTLGVITEATLRIFPKPETITILFYAFADFETAFKALLKIRRAGLSPTIQLVVDKAGIEELIEEKRCPETSEGGLVLVYEGLKEEVEALRKRTVKILAKEGGIYMGEDVGRSFWESRHKMFSLMNKKGTYDSIDTAVPINRSLEFYKFLREWVEKHKDKIKSMGISSWVLPENVSIDVAFDESSPESINAYLKARDEVISKALELGGTSSYCVGIGIRYPHFMRKEHGAAFDVMVAIKRALDPNNIMNPGKLGL
ncbi:MAG: FAD-binding oxidoreductase [Candidatus Bathyarchaeia archaeon]